MSGKVSGAEGFVYILVNPAFPRLVKIGKTTVSPSSRAKDISRGTGVPAEFQVAWACQVVDCHLAERLLHSKFDAYRFRSNREFFEIAIEEAIGECTSICESHGVLADDTGSSTAHIQTPDAEGEVAGRGSKSNLDLIPRTSLLVAAEDVDLSTWVVGASPDVSTAIHRYVSLVREICPGVLGMIRNDRKIVFVPRELEMRTTRKNLTTIKASRRNFELRIIDDRDRLQVGKFERYHESMFEGYRVRLANLLSKLTVQAQRSS
jgi:hypothetical protein